MTLVQCSLSLALFLDIPSLTFFDGFLKTSLTKEHSYRETGSEEQQHGQVFLLSLPYVIAPALVPTPRVTLSLLSSLQAS